MRVRTSEVMTPHLSSLDPTLLDAYMNGCYEKQSGLICIYAGWSDTLYKLNLLKLTMSVDNIVFRIIKGAF